MTVTRKTTATDMQMYLWRSRALRQYRTGHVIVMADSSRAARELARKEFQAWLREHRSWLFDQNGYVHPDEQDEVEELLGIFEMDIADEPTTEPVLLIIGSE